MLPFLLLVQAASTASAQYWSAPRTFDIPLKHPVDSMSTQVSLYPDDGPVTILEGADLTAIAARRPPHAGPPMFIIMYDSGCPHCWHAVPKWTAVANAYQGVKKATFAAINCNDGANEKACELQDVSFFPHFRCYGCPKSSFCKDDPCDLENIHGLSTGMMVPKPDLIVAWVANATQGHLKPAHALAGGQSDEQGRVAVAIKGPPGTSNWISAFDLDEQMRSSDALRGILRAMWRGNNTDDALNVVKFLLELFRDLPNDLKKSTALKMWKREELMSLQRALEGEGAGVDPKRAVVEWGNQHDVVGIDKRETFLTESQGDPENENGYQTCKTSTCTLWSFLHLVTTVPAACAAFDKPRSSPQEVMTFVREVVKKYLFCKECQTHFLEVWDSCSFGRCNVGNSSDWQGMALWLWRVHQGVSLRVASYSTNSSSIDRRWPSVEDCPKCYREDLLKNKEIQDVPESDINEVLASGPPNVLDAAFDLDSTYRFLVESYVGATAGDRIAKSKPDVDGKTVGQEKWETRPRRGPTTYGATMGRASRAGIRLDAKSWLPLTLGFVAATGLMVLVVLSFAKLRLLGTVEPTPRGDEELAVFTQYQECGPTM